MIGRQVDIGGGRLGACVTHELAQDEQVDPGRGELGAVGVTQTMGPDPDRPRAVPMVAEQAPQARLGERPTGRRAAEDDEALNRTDFGGD